MDGVRMKNKKLEDFLIEKKVICYKCFRCGHTWPKKRKKPQICPKCKNRSWDKKIQKKD